MISINIHVIGPSEQLLIVFATEYTMTEGYIIAAVLCLLVNVSLNNIIKACVHAANFFKQVRGQDTIATGMKSSYYLNLCAAILLYSVHRLWD